MYASVDPPTQIMCAPIDPAPGRPRTPLHSSRRISAATASVPASCARTPVCSPAGVPRAAPNVPSGGVSTPVDAAASIPAGVLRVLACVPHVLSDRALPLAIVLRHQARRCPDTNHRSQQQCANQFAAHIS